MAVDRHGDWPFRCLAFLRFVGLAMQRQAGSMACILFLFLASVQGSLAEENIKASAAVESARRIVVQNQIGTDDRFDLFKANGKLRPETTAPKNLRSLMVEGIFAFQSLRTSIRQEQEELVLTWCAQAAFEGELADASKTIATALEGLGFSAVALDSPPPFAFMDVKLLQGSSRQLLAYRRDAGDHSEFALVPLKDRNARPDSTVQVGLLWYVSAPRSKTPLTLIEAFDVLPMLKPTQADQELLDAMNKGFLQRFEVSLDDDPTTPPRLAPLLLLTGNWDFETPTDLRPPLENVLPSVGFLRSQEDRRPSRAAQTEKWERDDNQEQISVTFFAPPARIRDIPSRLVVSGRYRKNTPVPRQR